MRALLGALVVFAVASACDDGRSDELRAEYRSYHEAFVAATFTATYEMAVSGEVGFTATGGQMTWYKRTTDAQRFDSAIESEEGEPDHQVILSLADDRLVCTPPNSSVPAGSCTRYVTAIQSSDFLMILLFVPATESLKEPLEVEDMEISGVTERRIAGTEVRCFEIVGVEGTSLEHCFTKDGVPARRASAFEGNGWTWTLTDVQLTVDDAVFDAPYPIVHPLSPPVGRAQ